MSFGMSLLCLLQNVKAKHYLLFSYELYILPQHKGLAHIHLMQFI